MRRCVGLVGGCDGHCSGVVGTGARVQHVNQQRQQNALHLVIQTA
jgi:hypothetical protein